MKKNFVHSMSLSASFFLLMVIVVNDAYALVYETIAQENLKSITEIDQQNNSMFSEKKFWQILKEKLVEHLHLSSKKKRECAYMILAEHEKTHPFPTNDFIDLTSWRDLELLCGPKSNPLRYVAAAIDRTSTEIGRITLYQKMIQPLRDSNRLTLQQRKIKTLIDDEALFNRIDKNLKKIAQRESAVMSFWGDDMFQQILVQYAMVQIPFSKKLSDRLNKSSLALEIKSRLSFFQLSSISAVMALSGTLLPLYGLAMVTDKGKSFCSFIENLGLKSFGVFGIFGALVYMINAVSQNKYTQGLGPVSALETNLQLPDMFDQMKSFITFDVCLQIKLMHVAHYVRALQDLALSIKRNEFLYQDPVLRDFCQQLKRRSGELSELCTLLNSSTFKGRASFLSYIGRVKAAYRCMDKVKGPLAHVMAAVGEIDAQMSIARWYKECEEKQVPCCFPIFEKNAVGQPSMEIRDCWSVQLVPEKAVPSSLELGQAERPRNMVITGPNAGGKSTIMRGFVLSILMAQTLGVAPAKSLRMTPCAHIMTYLNITDDTAAGNSYFKAGVLRAREIITMVQALKDDECALVAVDELFNGTSFKEGQAAAYSLIKLLGSHPRLFCLSTTHFPLLTRLEQENGLFANYKVTVDIDEQGKIRYPYKLERGISDQIITFNVLQEEGFSDAFLTEAQQMIQQEEGARKIAKGKI